MGEVALAAALPFMVRRLERSGWVAPVGWGVVEGAIMFVAWAGAFQLLH